MSIAFAARLSELRREKNITQKTAADELGISQALLSHYEKGIRECNLDFVTRAAKYYDVTTDWLLGNSDTKRAENRLFDLSDTPTDAQVKPETVMKTLYYLYTICENGNKDTEEIFFSDFFSLAIEKYIALTSKKDITLSRLCDIAVDDNEHVRINLDIPPLCIKTIDEHAMRLIDKKTEGITKH